MASRYENIPTTRVASPMSEINGFSSLIRAVTCLSFFCWLL